MFLKDTNFIDAVLIIFLIQAEMMIVMLSVNIFRALISHSHCSGQTQMTS